MKVFFLTFSLLFLYTNIVFSKNKNNVKNLIYFIGDGMGPAQITGARIYQGGSSFKLNLEKLDYTGFSKTYSSDEFVTDSAAAATALATGVKTYNGSVGMSDRNLKNKMSSPLENIFSLAKKAGKSVGIITTTRITHATPAAFYAHAKDRDEEQLIADQLLTSPFDLFLGGGRAFFLGKEERDTLSGKKGERVDNRNLIKEFKENNILYMETAKDLKDYKFSNQRQLHKKIVGLFNISHMEFDFFRQKSGIEPSLTEMLDFAIKHLSQNAKGYVILVEGGKIDHAGHDNRAKLAFTELVAMDLAIGRAFEEIKKNTLVVVTADHETGGLALQGYGKVKIQGEQLLSNQVKEDGSYDVKNNYIAWSSGPGAKLDAKFDSKDPAPRQKSLYNADSAYHTAIDVLVGASGPCSSFFRGYMENTEIPKKISHCLNLNLK